MGLPSLAVPVSGRDGILDKSGTTGWQTEAVSPKRPKKQEPANAGSFDAEREGFSDAKPTAKALVQQLHVLWAIGSSGQCVRVSISRL
jgi:hypothetical protein